jgi:dihydroorotate dehydrogenase electron transfer subunit
MTFSGAVSLLDNRDLGAGHYLAAFDAPQIAARVRPAQFVMVRVRQGTDPLLARPFSVARVGVGRSRPTVELLYKIVGRGTTLMAEMAAGARVGMVGPLGNPFPDPTHPDSRVFLVAGGIGIAPFPLLAAALREKGFSMSLLYGARSAPDLIGRDLLPKEGVEVRLATDDGSAGHHGPVTELLDRELDGLPAEERRRSVSYVCGPTPMMVAADAILERYQAGGHFSVESLMGCGFGVCLSCVIPLREGPTAYGGYQRICVDGPTFPAGCIDWPRSETP